MEGELTAVAIAKHGGQLMAVPMEGACLMGTANQLGHSTAGTIYIRTMYVDRIRTGVVKPRSNSFYAQNRLKLRRNNPKLLLHPESLLLPRFVVIAPRGCPGIPGNTRRESRKIRHCGVSIIYRKDWRTGWKYKRNFGLQSGV